MGDSEKKDSAQVAIRYMKPIDDLESPIRNMYSRRKTICQEIKRNGNEKRRSGSENAMGTPSTKRGRAAVLIIPSALILQQIPCEYMIRAALSVAGCLGLLQFRLHGRAHLEYPN